MAIKNILLEDFVNYKKPSLFIGIGTCTFKCCKECGMDIKICQNYELAHLEPIPIDYDKIVDMYKNNSITEAIVIGGMEPFDDIPTLINIINTFRVNGVDDDIIIYSGYYPYEILDALLLLQEYDNIIIKFGRYRPNEEPHIDNVLGVNLVSNNQYAARLSKDTDITKAIKDNDGYCPCQLERSDSTLCACKTYRTTGECHCGIFEDI